MAIYEALAQYGSIDDDAVKRLKSGVHPVCPDATDSEIVHFIHVKGALTQKRRKIIDNAIGFLCLGVLRAIR